MAGTRETITAAEYDQRRRGRYDQPLFQVRICRLGDWTMVIEEGTAIHLLPWPAWGVRPSFPPGVASVRVDWTLTTGIGMRYVSGGPAESASWYGDVLGPPDGYLAEVADRIGLVHGQPGDGDAARLLMAAADDLGIPAVPMATVLGPLLTVTRTDSMP